MSFRGKLEGKTLSGKINKLVELRGYSAYEVAVLNGFEGTEEEWLASLQGAKGDPGTALVTSVNGQIGDVTLPTSLMVTVTKQADGSYDADLHSEEIVEAINAGKMVYCQNGYRILSLLYAADYRCVFGCVHAGYVHTVTVSAGSVSVSSTPLASGGSGSGADGITPHIGDNGNWFIGETDTGMPSRGETGAQGPAYVLTDADWAAIVAEVIQSLGGNPVFGYVDENNNIIVSGNLADGTYTVKYEQEDGSTVEIGALVLDNNVYYSITNTLTNCVNSNGAAQIVEGGSYTATVSANSGYELSSVTVTMGGVDIAASAVSGGNINIAKVTGDIVITAVAEEAVSEPVYTNLADPSDANWKEGIRLNSSYSEVAADGMVTTNLIEAVKGNIIRVKGLSFGSSSNERVVQYLNDTANNAIISTVNTDLFSTSGDVTTITLDGSAVMVNSTHVRICGTLTGTSDDVIITVNEEIV